MELQTVSLLYVLRSCISLCFNVCTVRVYTSSCHALRPSHHSQFTAEFLLFLGVTHLSVLIMRSSLLEDVNNAACACCLFVCLFSEAGVRQHILPLASS